MNWWEKIIGMHLRVTDQVSHGQRLESERYFVWQEEGANDLIADGTHAQRAVRGSTDLFTKSEFDAWAREFEQAMNETGGLAWYLNSVDFEPDTGFYHYEWVWQVL